MVTIYGLIDPRDQQVRYIGQTGKLLAARLASHIRRGKSQRGKHRLDWIRCLIGLGLVPTIISIDRVTREEADDFEKYWIELFEESGYDLVNGTNGGHEQYRLREEVRKTIGEKAKGFHHSEKSKSQISQKLMGHPVSTETRKKMREGWTRRKESGKKRKPGFPPNWPWSRKDEEVED